MACHRSTRPSHCAARSRVLTTYRARQCGWGSAPRTDALCYYIIIKGTMWSSLHCLLLRTPLSHAAIATGLQAEPVWNLKDVCLPSFSWLCCWPNVEDSTTQGRAEPQEEELEFLNHYMEDCCAHRNTCPGLSQERNSISVPSHFENYSLSVMVRRESFSEGSASGNADCTVVAVYGLPSLPRTTSTRGTCEADLYTKKEPGRLRKLRHPSY